MPILTRVYKLVVKKLALNRGLAQSTAQLLDRSLDLGKVIVDDGFVGPGYAQASKEGEIAAQTFAELEVLRFIEENMSN